MSGRKVGDHQLTAQREPVLEVADIAETDDAELEAARHCESTEAGGVESEMVSPGVCGLESGMLTRVEIPVKAERSIVVSLVWTSWPLAAHSVHRPHASANATLAAMSGLMNSGRTTETACDRCDMGGCGMSTDSA